MREHYPSSWEHTYYAFDCVCGCIYTYTSKNHQNTCIHTNAFTSKIIKTSAYILGSSDFCSSNHKVTTMSYLIQRPTSWQSPVQFLRIGFNTYIGLCRYALTRIINNAAKEAGKDPFPEIQIGPASRAFATRSMADVIEAGIKLPGIGNDRLAAAGVTGRVYSQAKRYAHSGSIPNPIWEMIVHVLPTNVFIKSDGPRIFLPLVEPPAAGDGTAEDRFCNFFTLNADAVDNHDRMMHYLNSVCGSKGSPGAAWGPGSFLLYPEFGYPAAANFADDYDANPLVFSPEARVYSNIFPSSFTLGDAMRTFIFPLCYYLTVARPNNVPAANIAAVVQANNVVMMFNFIPALVTESAALNYFVNGKAESSLAYQAPRPAVIDKDPPRVRESLL